MRRRLVSVVGVAALFTGLLAGCSGAAEAGTFATGIREHGITGPELEEPAKLVMPHRAVTLTKSVVTSTLDEQLVTDLNLGEEELDAAGDHEFVAVSFTVDEASYADDGGEGRVNVVTEDTTHDVTEDFVDQLVGQDEVVVVVSVPVDSPVSLEITDEGKTASLDLRTAKRSEQTMSDSTGAYYPDWSHGLSGELASVAVIGPTDPANAAEPGTVSIELDLSSARVSADGWIPGVGWVPSGQAYLLVSDVLATFHFAASVCSVGWDPVSSVTFTPDGGSPVQPTGFAGGELFTWADFAFVIPQDTKAGTLALEPQAVVSSNCQFSQPFATASLPVELGG